MQVLDIVNVFIIIGLNDQKKCLNVSLGITNQNKCAINLFLQMIQLFCCGFILIL